MRICMVTEYFNPDGAGGVPSMLPMLAQRLCARYPDVKVDVVTSRNIYRGETHQRRPAFEHWEGIDAYRLSTPRSNQTSISKRLLAGCYFTASALAKLTALPAYDVILSSTSPPMVPAAAKTISVLYVVADSDRAPEDSAKKQSPVENPAGI